MATNERSGIQPEAQSVKLIEQIELGAKLSAGAVALTYVSGYLIEASYLGTFSIHPDASDFFRARYLYIGFNYWFLVAAFVVALIFARRLVGFCHSWLIRRDLLEGRDRSSHSFDNENDLPESLDLTHEETQQARRILERRVRPARLLTGQSFANLRWTAVVSSIIIVFSVQIVFMTPGDVRRIIPLQFIFLFVIAIHQATHFREYFDSWGILHGRLYVALLRLFAMVVEVLLSFWILGRVLFPVGQEPAVLHDLYAQGKYVYWGVVGVGLTCGGYASASLMLNYRQLTSFDLLEQERLSLRSAALRLALGFWERGSGIGWRRRALMSLWLGIVIVVVGGALWLYKHPTELQNGRSFESGVFGLFGWATLILSLCIPANILMLAAMRQSLHARLGIAHLSGSTGDKYVALTLRVIPITVLYLVSVLSFAHVLYSKIPGEKAGGSYLDSRLVRINMIRGTSTGACSLEAVINFVPVFVK